VTTRYRILRDDGLCDGIAGLVFDSYDAAHEVLERYYADLCCSDEREYYRIDKEPPADGIAPDVSNTGPGQLQPSGKQANP
jgi:hypothetical protein